MTLLQSLPAGGADRVKASEAKGLLDEAVKTLPQQYLAQGRKTLESFDSANVEAKVPRLSEFRSLRKEG
jgi:hypothetical protein